MKGKAYKNFAMKNPVPDIPSRDALTASWQAIQEAICNAPMLKHPDLTKPFILYTNGSKEFGYGAAIHQVDEDGRERSVLFLSRTLRSLERNYGSTELETGALVWVLSARCNISTVALLLSLLIITLRKMLFKLAASRKDSTSA